MFKFFVNTNVSFGAGCIATLTDVLLAERWLNIGMLVDQNVAAIRQIEELVSFIRKDCESLVIENCTISEPTYDYLEKIRPRFMEKGLQVMIGIGGGSMLDVAKGMAVLINNKGPAIQYRGFDKMTEPVLPVIALPTTAGSGSEITPNASFVDIAEKRKMGINGEAVRPKYAFIDPQLTISCPEGPTISAGIDAIVHAIGSYISKGHNTVSRVFSAEGFKRTFNYLPLVIDDPMNISYRSEVMIGAFFSAIGMIHSGGCASAVLSYPLGVNYGVPHGLAGGIFLPYVVEHNIQRGITDYADLYRLIRGADVSLPVEKQANEFLEMVRDVWAKLAIPKDITRYGYEPVDMEKFITDAMELKGGLDGNPVPFYQDEIQKVLERLI